MRNDKPTGPPSDGGLFGNLLASKPPKAGAAATAATATSLLVHGAVIAGLVWATLALGKGVSDEVEQITLIRLEEEPPPPPPPPPPLPPDAPPPPVVAAAIDVPRGFQTLTPPEIILPEIPPPAFGLPISALDFTGEGIEGGRADGNPENKEKPKDELMLAPSMTPFTVRPELKNRQEVGRAMERHYPPMLRDAGIGGRVVLWFLIDEEGNVLRTTLQQTSGYTQLDEAAAKVAPVMKFSPALNRDQRVIVWVEIPITFQAM